MDLHIDRAFVNGPAPPIAGIARRHHIGEAIGRSDFDVAIERVANPKGDRVKIVMSGKFLSYKYYGNSGNVPDYGYKEE